MINIYSSFRVIFNGLPTLNCQVSVMCLQREKEVIQQFFSFQSAWAFFCLFRSQRPSQRFFSHVRTGRTGLTRTKQRIKSLAQGHNTVPPVRLEPATPQSRVKHPTTEPPQSSKCICMASRYCSPVQQTVSVLVSPQG